MNLILKRLKQFKCSLVSKGLRFKDLTLVLQLKKSYTGP